VMFGFLKPALVWAATSTRSTTVGSFIDERCEQGFGQRERWGR
jgi:hypothetical protein